MRVGVVSDVHNNLEALSYALEHLRSCDVILGLGDLISDYRVDARAVELCRGARVFNILGNHEKSILRHPGSQVRRRMSAEILEYLGELPASREIELDGRKVHVAHGSPWDDPTDTRCVYVIERDRPALARVAATTQADVVLLGHTHRAMAVRHEQTLVLNPGSSGEARDSAGRLTFATLDGVSGVASVYVVRQGLEPELLLQAEF
jgi:putative phosphoesterase